MANIPSLWKYKMKKHRHEAMIKEWLDNDMPPVEELYEINSWASAGEYPQWFEVTKYRLVYPPKLKKKIEMFCWLCNDMLIWQMDRCAIEPHWERVPSEDKIIEVDE